MRILPLVFALVALLPLRAADPKEPIQWTAEKTKEIIRDAESTVNKETGMGPSRFMDSAFLMYREKNSGAEAHTTTADFIIINEGSGVILMGGRIVNGKEERPNEIRGDSIEGGKEYAVKAGDTLYVPKNYPHQFRVAPGQHMVYTVVKITPVE